MLRKMIVNHIKQVEFWEALYMNDILTLLMAQTGDSSKPLLIAICLIISVILTVVLVITGRMINKKDDEDDDEEDDIEDDK